jgi:hypothetical protein
MKKIRQWSWQQAVSLVHIHRRKLKDPDHLENALRLKLLIKGDCVHTRF